MFLNSIDEEKVFIDHNKSKKLPEIPVNEGFMEFKEENENDIPEQIVLLE
jgi:hypothetical protein